MPGKNDICFQIIFKEMERNLYKVGVKWYEAEDRKKWSKNWGGSLTP